MCARPAFGGVAWVRGYIYVHYTARLYIIHFCIGGLVPGMALAAVLLGLFVLALFSSVNSQSPIEYVPMADLDYCGQSSPSSCEETEAWFAVCRCDTIL